MYELKLIKKIGILSFIFLSLFLIVSTSQINTSAVVYNASEQQFEFEVKYTAHADVFTVIVTEDDRVIQLRRLATIEPYQDLTSHFTLDNDDFIVGVKNSNNAFVVHTFKGDIYTWNPSSTGLTAPEIGRGNDTVLISTPKRIYRHDSSSELTTFDVDLTIGNIIAIQNNRSMGYSGSGFLSTFTRQTLDFLPVNIETLENDDFIERIYGGYNNAILVSRNQRLYFWGSNSSNRFFPGSTNIQSLYDFTDLIEPFFDDNIEDGIKDIQINLDNIFIQTKSNQLIAWGLNAYGQLGTGNTTALTEPTNITSNFVLSGETLKTFSVTKSNQIENKFTAVLSNEGTLTMSGFAGPGIFDVSITENVLTPIDLTSRYQSLLSNNETIEMIDTNALSLLVVTSENQIFVNGRVRDASDRTFTLLEPTSIQDKLSIVRDKKVPLDVEQMFVIRNGIVTIDSNGDIYGAGHAVNWRMLGLGSNQERTSFLSSNFKFDDVMKNYEMVAFDQGDSFGIAAFDNGNVYTWGANYISNGGVVRMRESNSTVEFNNITDALNLNANEKVIEVSAKSPANISVLTDQGRVLSWGKKDVLTGETGNVNTSGSDTGPVDMTSQTHVTSLLNQNETITKFLEPMLVITSEGRILDISFNNVFTLDDTHQLPNNEEVLFRSEKYYLSDANKVYEYVAGTGFTDITANLLANINAAPYSDNSTGILSFDVDNFTSNNTAMWSLITTNNRIYRLDINLNVIEEHTLTDLFNNDVPIDIQQYSDSRTEISYYVLTQQGFIYSFGHNEYGKLAIGTEVDTTTFTLVNPLETRHFEIKYLSIPATTLASQPTVDVTFLMNHDVSDIISEIDINGTYYPIADFTVSNTFYYSITLTHNTLVSEAFEVSVDNVKLIDGTIIPTSGDTTQHTRITDEVYALIFDINYETTFSTNRKNTILIEKGASLPTLGTINRQTYTFDGWYLDQEVTDNQLPTTMPNNDLILYAKWAPLPYTLEFEYVYRNNSNNIVTGSIFSEDIPHSTDLSDYVLPDAPEIEGYEFRAWRQLPATMPANNTTIYADYDVASFDITFVTNLPEGAEGEASKVETLTFGFGISTTRYGITSAPGYSFLGWYATEDFSTPRVTSVPASDTTLYARFVPTEYRFYYLNTNNSFLFYDQNDPTFSFGEDISGVVPPVLTPPEGYRVGWFIDSNRTNELTFDTMPALPLRNGEIELFQVYAKFVPLDYTYTFEVNGGLEIGPLVQGFATNLTLPEALKVGHVFEGWYTDQALTTEYTSTTVEASNVTLYAKYTIGNYELNFIDFDDSEIEAFTFDFNTDLSTLELPDAPTRAGFTFSGWSIEVPATMPAENINIQALYTANIHQLTLINNNGSEHVVTDQSYLDTLTLPTPTRTGYTFNGWFTDEGLETANTATTMPDNDVTLYAKWTINEYTITFNSNAGSTVTAITQDYNTAVTSPSAPTRTGYTFNGWFSDEALETAYVFTNMPAENITLYAKWTINQYTITFDSAGGTEIASITQDYNTAVVAPSDPTRTGYTFSGWDNTVPATMPADNVTLTATWTINEYTLSFNSNEGSVVTAITQDYNTAVTSPSAPTRTGYTFNGWFSDEALETAYVFSNMPAENITLYAKWTINQYTITFDSAGGTEVTAITQDYNTAVVAPSAPTRTGYTFSGWDTNVPTTMPADNVTLTATWTINEYTVSFNSNEGSAVIAITQDYNTAVTAPSAPTRTGYTFNGWFSDEALETAYVFSNMPAENITLYAKWTINTYTLTFDSAGGTEVASITQDYNTAVATPSDPTRTGYTFSGWDVTVPSTIPAEDITFTATWTINEYTITFNTNNGTIAQDQISTYTIESSNIALLDASRTGFVFKGWYLEATFETEITQIQSATELSDITLHALFFSDDFQAYLNAIETLPTPLSKEDKETILDLLEALDTYSTFEQGYVDKDGLEEALSEVKALEVTYVETLITSIPSPINYEDLESIEAAKDALDALDNDQQEDVSNQELLNTLLEILVVVEQIEALVNSEEIDKASYEALLLEFDGLSEEQQARISESVLLDYEVIQDEMSGLGLFAWIGISFSLLLLLLLILWYLNNKRKELKEA